jgi:TPR repeat protein
MLALIKAAAGAGVDIVRIPPTAEGGGEPATHARAEPAPSKPLPQPGRFYTLPITLGSLPNAPQRGWLGVKMEPVELPLALALGLVNGNGAFIAEATPGGPAAQGGIRFGDIIVSVDATALANVAELRQRIAASVPGAKLSVEAWRATGSDGDFMGLLRQLADGGNGYVMYRLGRMYALGSGVTRDEHEAVRWYGKGAAAGDAEAMTGLAHALIDGRGIDKDVEKGLSWLKKAVDKGNAEATYALGVIALEGKLAARDPSEALRLFTSASEASYAPAMVDLGLMYDNGNGVAADYHKAAFWYRRAAELGNSAGMVNLGYLYARGKGVEQNDALAVAWYRRAVADGNAAGMHNLAVMADGGRGMPHDPELAAGLILQALEQHYDFSYRQMTQAPRNWSKEFRRALQRRLRDAGVYAGNVDGEFRDTTISALDAYINRNR